MDRKEYNERLFAVVKEIYEFCQKENLDFGEVLKWLIFERLADTATCWGSFDKKAPELTEIFIKHHPEMPKELKSLKRRKAELVKSIEFEDP